MYVVGVKVGFLICRLFVWGWVSNFQVCKLLGCRNPSLGLTTKARSYKVAGQEGNPGVTLHAPGSVGRCEGMNPHTFKGDSTLGVGVLMDFQIFKE